MGKNIQLLIVGQSNEESPGTAPMRNQSGFGVPLCDPLPPFGKPGKGSMYPRLAELLGRDGHRLFVRNTARSSTSTTQAWAGMMLNYATDTVFSTGVVVIAAGNIYKATASSGPSLNGKTGAVAPAFPGSGTVTDGQITWTYQRPATASDVPETVFKEGDEFFDPNGFVANTFNFASPLAAFDLNIVMISNGQQDATIQTSRSRYRDGIINIGDYFEKRKVVPMVGFSFYAPTLVGWMDNELIPALGDVFNARPQWKRGPILRQTRGALPTAPATGPGLQLETPPLHANNTALMMAAADIHQAMKVEFGL